MLDDRNTTAPAAPASRPLDARPAVLKSAVTNGGRLHVTGDGRGAAARRYRDLFAAYRDALGRPATAAEDALCRLAASLALRSELLAADMAAGVVVEPDGLVRIGSALTRALVRLGLLNTGKTVASADPQSAWREAIGAE